MEKYESDFGIDIIVWTVTLEEGVDNEACFIDGSMCNSS